MAKWFRQRPHINESYWWKSEEESVHHIFPTSRWWANIEENKIKLYKTLHESRHRIMGNATPIEAIRQLLSINKKVLSEDFLKELYYLLEQWYDNRYYKDWIRRKK